MFEKKKDVLLKSQNAKYYIDQLGLEKHPEGGYYKEVYRCAEYYYPEGLPDRYSSGRSFSTSIYYLLAGKDVSNFHRLKSDEIWHFLDGSSARIYILDDLGKLSEIIIGKKLDFGERLQAVIGKGSWFAAEVTEKDSFSLVSCTVAPGFEFNDFELADRDDLLKKYPGYRDEIIRFTRR
jgi:uncharacterized protein